MTPPLAPVRGSLVLARCPRCGAAYLFEADAVRTERDGRLSWYGVDDPAHSSPACVWCAQQGKAPAPALVRVVGGAWAVAS